MKKITLSILLLIHPVICPANILPAGKDSKDIMVGVTGIVAAIKDGETIVTDVTAGTPAEGKLQKGDVLLEVFGKSLQIQDPRHPLGFAINAAEGGDGSMEFSIKRDGKLQKATIQLKPIGRYSATYPIDCRKSKYIVDETAAFILAIGGPGEGINGNLEALFLLSTGEEKYLPTLEKYAASFIGKGAGGSTWHIGYSGIFLGEYYLAAGDKSVLPALQDRCEALKTGLFFDGWGHNVTGVNPGYVTGGVLNSAGVQALTTLIISRECGVEVDEKTYDKALKFMSRFAGRGGVAYGNHHPEYWWSSNGKNGGLASALTLLPGKAFQGGAQLLALSETNSYWGNEAGHGSSFGNETWRNIVDALVMDVHPESWRRHKDEMIWYYELSRMPGGGFRTPAYIKGNTIGKEPLYQTGLVAMAYTAHLKNLRICGKPRTKFSVPHKPTAAESVIAFEDFHRTDFIEGAVIKEQPHEIAEIFRTLYNSDGTVKTIEARGDITDKRKKQMPASWYAKLMRHYDPAVRDWAAHGLGFLGEEAVPEITKALASKDARLRAAGLDAISCSTGWSLGKTTSNITPEMIKQHFMPQIIAPLKDSKATMWEKRHALMALSCAAPEEIKPHLDLLEPLFTHEDWWIGVASFECALGLIEDTEAMRPLIPAMLACYDSDTLLPSRRWGSTNFFKKAIAANPDLKDEIVAGMAKSVNGMKIRDGIQRSIDVNNAFETLRYIDMKKQPANAEPFLPAIERVYPDLTDLQANWTIKGAKWGNIGLANAGDLLGKDGKSFVESMKRIRPVLAKRPMEAKKGKPSPEADALRRLDEMVAKWEEKFGAVEMN